MPGLPLPLAAQQLGISARRLRRLIEAGAPVARRGRRGSGGAALVDVDRIAAWIRAREDERTPPAASSPDLASFAERVAGIAARATHEAFAMADGPHKRTLARELVKAWYLVATAIRAELGAPAPDVTRLPMEILNLVAAGD